MADRIKSITSYQCTDGKCFANMYEAEDHQSAIEARQKLLSELKGATLENVEIDDKSGDVTLVFVSKSINVRYDLSIGGEGGDGTTHTTHELRRIK